MEWFIEDQAFLLSSDSAPRLPPPPSHFRMPDLRHTGRLKKGDNMLTGEGGKGMGEEPILNDL
jgi:hypothetical protein